MIKVLLVAGIIAGGAYAFNDLNLSDAMITITAVGAFVATVILALMRDA